VRALGGLAALAALGVGLWQLGCEVRPDGPGSELESPGDAGAPPLEAIRPEGMAVVPVYSPVIRSGGFLFLSGAVGTVPGGGLVEGGVEAETRQALANVATLLGAAGAEVADLVRCTVYLADVADYQVMNAVYGAFVADPPPARTTVGVAGLPLGARVEVECVARDPAGA
jgi:reactive intermediate/imine deaminase